MKLTDEAFEDHSDNSAGYCTQCDRITRDATEPDADGYECPECQQDTVMGMDNALVEGHITITEESEDQNETEEADGL